MLFSLVRQNVALQINTPRRYKNGEPLASFFVKQVTESVHGTNRNVTMVDWLSIKKNITNICRFL